MGIRTPDIQLAKLALYQLSYTPHLRQILLRYLVFFDLGAVMYPVTTLNLR